MLASRSFANGDDARLRPAKTIFLPLRHLRSIKMDSGELLTRWTARIAMIFYALSLAQRLRTRSDSSATSATSAAPDALAAALWAVGCGVYLAHLAAAFGYYLHWSHTEGVAFTAVRSEQIVGWRFGGGIYFNYAFTIVWLVDVLWMIAGRASYARRPGWYDLVVHGFMAFMAFNGVVVFGPSPTREVGAVAVVVLIAIWWRSRPRLQSAATGSRG